VLIDNVFDLNVFLCFDLFNDFMIVIRGFFCFLHVYDYQCACLIYVGFLILKVVF